MSKNKILIFGILCAFTASCVNSNKHNSLESRSKNENTELNADKLYPDNREPEADDCIFDTAIYKFTTDILLRYDKNIKFSWDNETKRAKTLLSDGDTLYLSIGGCNYFGYSAELFTSIPFHLKDSLYKKAAWIAKTFFDNGFENYSEYITNGNYMFNKELSNEQYLYYDMTLSDTIPVNMIFTGFQFQQYYSKTIITINGYFD